MMFKPLSDALGFALALSIAAAPDAARHPAALDATPSGTAETRWGLLAVTPETPADTDQTLTLRGTPVAGLAAERLWIVRVEPFAADADRAVVAAATAEPGAAIRFHAVTISAAGAQPQPGSVILRLRGATATP
jgi:hypothetical protein